MAMLSKCFQRTVPFFFAARFSLRPQRRSVSEMEKAFFPLRKCTVFIFRKNRLRLPLWGSWGRAAPKSCGRRRETALAKRNRKGCATTAKHRKIALGLQMQGGGVKPVFVTGERRQRSRCQSGDKFCGFAVPLSSAYWRRLSCFLLSAAKEGRPQSRCRPPEASYPNHATGYQIKISNNPGLTIIARSPKSQQLQPYSPNNKNSERTEPS